MLRAQQWRTARLRDRLRPRDENGYTVIELSMTIGILALVLGAFYGAYNGFIRDVGFAEQLGDIEREARPVLNELVIELRQAVPPSTAAHGRPVEYLSAGRIVFYSDRRDVAGPERYDYQLVNCADSLCDLQGSIYFADAATAYPNWGYNTALGPDYQWTVLSRVPESTVLFEGRKGGTTVTGCDRTDLDGLGAVDCDFDTVLVRIVVAPEGNPRPRDYEVEEEVTLRNARL
ncbi:MAG TPA: hypothetical protein ENI86_11830 [Acidimicrobiales bacterium]|nr:hypothetical protein [Acidimicrobiales bacterium]